MVSLPFAGFYSVGTSVHHLSITLITGFVHIRASTNSAQKATPWQGSIRNSVILPVSASPLAHLHLCQQKNGVEGLVVVLFFFLE